MSKGMNKLYEKDPLDFLKKKVVDATFSGKGMLPKVLKAKQQGGDWFNLVPINKPQNTQIDLTIGNPKSKFSAKHPKKAYYLHYTSKGMQKSFKDVLNVTIQRKNPKIPYLFSAGFSGCSIAVLAPFANIKHLIVYHDSYEAIDEKMYGKSGKILAKVEFKDYEYTYEQRPITRKTDPTGYATPLMFYDKHKGWVLVVQVLYLNEKIKYGAKSKIELQRLIIKVIEDGSTEIWKPKAETKK